MIVPLIVVRGPAGAGKTTLARRLATTLHEQCRRPVAHVEIDNLRYIFVSSDSEVAERLWIDLWKPIIAPLRENCAAIVVEGVLAERSSLEMLFNSHPDTILFQLDLTLQLCLKRNKLRSCPSEILDDSEVTHIADCLEPFPAIHLDGARAVEELVSEMTITLSQRFLLWT